MKAIKIPNTALLDVFGRAVATNGHDFRRFSTTEHSIKNSIANHFDLNSKNSSGTASGFKTSNAHLLTMIGLSTSLTEKRTYVFSR